MKAIIKIVLVCLLFMSFKGGTEKVYVCDSSTSVAYHETKECKGLNRCKHDIINITKKDAIDKYGKRACKICY